MIGGSFLFSHNTPFISVTAHDLSGETGIQPQQWAELPINTAGSLTSFLFRADWFYGLSSRQCDTTALLSESSVTDQSTYDPLLAVGFVFTRK